MKLILVLLLSFLNSYVIGQFRVIVKLVSVPDKPVAEKIYLTGNFNDWNPNDDTFKMQKDPDGKWVYVAEEVDPGRYEFKFTRGSWETVESTADGKNISNRVVEVISDTVIELSISGWATVAGQTKKHTASKQVRIMDSAFYIPQLKRYRRIWIYLPADYASSKNRYPVLYLHDGQNVFDEATSFAGEWGVDEAMDSMKVKSIVVAIDNGGEKRMNEYNPYNHERFGKGEGKLYVDFLAKTLKPYIDKKYRTKKEPSSTMVAGSSMGGLISMYTVIRYPDVFGKAGVFSPAFWTAPALDSAIKQNVKRATHGRLKIFLYAGEQEGKPMVMDMLRIFERMHKQVGNPMDVRINAEGKHDEPTWRAEFPIFYKWITK